MWISHDIKHCVSYHISHVARMGFQQERVSFNLCIEISNIYIQSMYLYSILCTFQNEEMGKLRPTDDGWK